MKISQLLLIFFLILPFKAFSSIELGFDFGYDKQIYGAQRQNNLVSRNYSGGMSFYLFDLTAVDLNASTTDDTTSQNDRYTVATGIDVIAQQNRMKSEVYGLGIKQMLAGRGALLTPIVSVGYAREFVTSSGDITVENTTSKVKTVYNLTETKQRYNSVFGSFILQLKLTERFSLKASVKTLFPAFEFNKARDNVKFSAGFSWIF
jgi:uncharacterized protein YhjY with autotransporter beta-barrel domain